MRDQERTDILIIVPELPETSWLNAAVAGVTPPLGAAYLAGYARSRGLRAVVMDNCVELKSHAAVAEAAAALSPRLVALTSTTTNFPTLLSMAAALKKALPATPVVAGGPHSSALPAETLSEPAIDFVVKGEGEVTLTELLLALRSGGDFAAIDGLCYKESGEVRMNRPRQSISDLDSMPFPAYDLLPMDRYHPSLSRRIARGAMGSLITARGCPYRCTFCSNSVFGSSLRLRSPANILEEVALLKRDYGIGELLVWDDTFTLDADRAIEIARGIKRVADVPWSCYSRVDDADDGLYAELAGAGCTELLFGAESGNNAILSSTNKRITREQTAAAVGLCRRHGISSFCSVILGLPGDTRATIRETIDFFVRLDPDYAAFCLLIPFPGTEIFRHAVAKGLIDVKAADWRSYVKIFSSTLPPVSLCDVPREELVALQKEAFRRFFMRPGYVSGRVKRSLGRGLARRSVSFCRGALSIMRHQLHRFSEGR